MTVFILIVSTHDDIILSYNNSSLTKLYKQHEKCGYNDDRTTLKSPPWIV